MAFFMNMPAVIVLLLHLILSPPLFIHQAKIFAVADYKLIQTLCHNSETPETCMRCAQSSKGAVKADGVGIAIVIVNCINDKANTLALNMTNLASSSHGNLKSVCQKCAKDYGLHIAKKELISTKRALQNHKYDSAESSVVRALSFDLACHADLKRGYHDKVPSDVFYDMKMYEELSEAASRIIEKL
ncbi:pectinesterase protein [Spatholobus suberectus]|nr:pectinesterase protein [Spatholobus suberectus]